MKIKYFIVFAVLMFMASNVLATETYIESMQKLREEQQESKKEIIAAVVSFNQAFKDTFRLIDDEFSRLIYSMVGLVGVVFSIMFLVYAKTTSRYKRDIQILMKAHSQHIDNLISTRLDEFVARLDARMMQESETTLSRLENDFDTIVNQMVPKQETIEQVQNDVEVAKPTTKPDKIRRFDTIKAKVSMVEEPKIEADGRVKVLSKRTSPLNRFKKRVRSGLRRLFGKKKETSDVKEFKE